MQKWVHENPEILHIGTLEARNEFTPFAAGQDPFRPKEESSLRLSMNGQWDFAPFESPERAGGVVACGTGAENAGTRELGDERVRKTGIREYPLSHSL